MKISIFDYETGELVSRDATVEEEEAFLSSLPAASEAPVPSQISDRQFFQQLAVMDLISEAEAIAAVSTGTLPAAMAGFIDQLPAEQRFAARMALQGATTFVRSNPLVETFGAMQGMTPEQVDDLWRAASLL